MRSLCKSKIHRTKVTETNKDYVGSIAIDEKLMDKADIWPNEKVLIVNLENGERWETYAIPAKRNSGTIGLYGGGALKAKPGDLIIVIAFAITNKKIKPRIVLVDNSNRFKKCLL